MASPAATRGRAPPGAARRHLLPARALARRSARRDPPAEPAPRCASGAKTSRPRWIVAARRSGSSRVACQRASPWAPIAPGGVSGSSPVGERSTRAAGAMPGSGQAPDGTLGAIGPRCADRLAGWRPRPARPAAPLRFRRSPSLPRARAGHSRCAARAAPAARVPTARMAARAAIRCGTASISASSSGQAASNPRTISAAAEIGSSSSWPNATRRRDRELADAQRAGDVAEVDHAARHQPAGAVAPADHVPVGHVAVHDLAAAVAARAARRPRLRAGRDPERRARGAAASRRAERAPRRPRRRGVDPTASRGRQRRARSSRAQRATSPATPPSERSTGGARCSASISGSPSTNVTSRSR